MPTPVTAIRNLGPATAEGFAKAGLTTAEEIRALGPDEAYRRWLAAGQVPHFIGYYALVMGLQGRPWNDCRGAEKAALRLRFDALMAERGASGSSQHSATLDRALDLLGVVPPRKG